MSLNCIGSNNLACTFKPNYMGGRNTIGFYNLNNRSEEYLEAIKELHQVYMDKLSYFQNNPKIDSEQVVNYHVRYLDTLVNIFYSFSSKYSTTNSLPFGQMGNLLRAVQGFVLDFSIARSIIKLRNELYGSVQVQPNMNFSMAAFNALIKAGNLLEAKKLFQKHPNYLNYPQAKHIEACFNPENRVFGLMYMNEQEFLTHFEKSAAESQKVLRACEQLEDFHKICKILTGNLEYFFTLKPNWLELIIFFSLFKVGIIYNTEEVAKLIISYCPVKPGLEKMLLTCFIDNLHSVVQQASEVFPSFFIAHLVDILAVCEKANVDPQDVFEGLNYPEYYFLNFVNEILPNPDVPLELVCDYIYHNLGAVENCEELLKYANKLRVKPENIERSVQYFNSHELESIALGTYKYAAIGALNDGKLSLAIEFSLKSKDQEFKYLIESRVLNIASELPTNHIRLIVQGFSQNYHITNIEKRTNQHSSVIIHFFSVYIKYIDYIENKQITDAGNLLVKFFSEDTAPSLFYKAILTASIPLFDSGLLLSPKNLFIVLKAYENLCRQPNIPPTTIQTLSQVLSRAASSSLT